MKQELNDYGSSLIDEAKPAENEGGERSAQKQEPAENKKAATDGGQEAAGKVSNIGSNKASKGGEVVVTGKEFGEYKDIKELRKKAVQYYVQVLKMLHWGKLT